MTVPPEHVSVDPAMAAPEMDGAAVHTGAARAAVIGPTDADVADTLPAAFVPVTVAVMLVPRSAVTSA